VIRPHVLGGKRCGLRSSTGIDCSVHFGPLCSRWRQAGGSPERAVEWSSDPLGATRVVQHPRTELEWWSVADVLAVAAGKLRDPVSRLVLAKAGDRTIHSVILSGFCEFRRLLGRSAWPRPSSESAPRENLRRGVRRLVSARSFLERADAHSAVRDISSGEVIVRR
jgi:hypothetical protein